MAEALLVRTARASFADSFTVRPTGAPVRSHLRKRQRPPPPRSPPPAAQSTASVSANPRHISVSALRVNASGINVERFQVALRAFAARNKIPVSRINPSGATGIYKSETVSLTQAVLKTLKKHSKTWTRVWKQRSKYSPDARLIRKLGMIPIK